MDGFMKPRLFLAAKRPVSFPDVDPGALAVRDRQRTLAGLWRACGEAMLEGNEPCMEMCESVEQIAGVIRRKKTGLMASKEDHDRYRISAGRRLPSLLLEEADDGTISVVFGRGESLDVTDYGPNDVVLFLEALFSCRKKMSEE